jgi:hypothetical protein
MVPNQDLNNLLWSDLSLLKLPELSAARKYIESIDNGVDLIDVVGDYQRQNRLEMRSLESIPKLCLSL